MTDCGVDAKPVMATTPTELAVALSPLVDDFPAVHSDLVLALGRHMATDGVITFTVTELAKDADVRLRFAAQYLREARERALLHVLGRRTDDGRIRYCAYHRPEASSKERGWRTPSTGTA